MSGSSGDMSPHALARREELACDAALFGLDDEERAELHALGADAEDLLALELSAGEIAARAYAALGEEVLPAALRGRVLADVERAIGSTENSEDPASEERSGGRTGSGPRAPRGAGAAAESEAGRPAPVIPLRAKEEREADPSRETARSPGRRRDVRRSLPRVRDAAPWALAAAAIVLAILARRGRVEGPVAGPAPAPAVTGSSDAGAPETPASAREALLAIAGTQELAWKATEDPSAAGAGGDVVWHNGAQRGFMRFRGLAANDPAKAQYQLWIFDGERDDKYPVDGGVFNVGPDGEVIVPIAAKLRVNRPTLFAVTVEKPGGVVVSKRERIVLTAAPPPT